MQVTKIEMVEMTTNRLLIKNANYVDVESGDVSCKDILSVDGRIRSIEPTIASGSEDDIIDAEGSFVIPGLIDSHVHVTSISESLGYTAGVAPTYVALATSRVMRGMLHRGFTTVRDVGGADYGLHWAQQDGFLPGPRLFYCGHAISQTGGHTDFRKPGDHASNGAGNCCASVGRVADGADGVRVAVRDELRKGAHHIKIIASGGIDNPASRTESNQFTMDELRAAVDEANAAHKYVAAHAYNPGAIIRALQAGARSIEHGNFLDDEGGKLLTEREAFFVPNIVTYWAHVKEAPEIGLSKRAIDEIQGVYEAGVESLVIAQRHGAKIAFGSDLLGPMHKYQAYEFNIRAQVQDALSILQSATIVGAELIGEPDLGVIREGAIADLLILESNPLDDITSLYSSAPKLVVQNGVPIG